MPNEMKQIEDLLRIIDSLCDQMIEQQKRKVMKIGRELRPNLTDDDMLDPTSIPEIIQNARWTYEEGLMHGLVQAKVAVMRDGVAFLREYQDSE